MIVNRSQRYANFASLFAFVLFLNGCAEEQFVEESNSTASTTTKKYLYVASGTCYSGTGLTTFSNVQASNVIIRIDTETGVRESILADYNSS